MTVSFDEVRVMLLALPGVEEGTFFDTPSFKVRRKVLGRLRSEVDADSFVLTQVDEIERQMLMAKDPEVYYFTAHYANYPSVLIHLSRADPEELRELIEQSWRRLASKRLLGEYEAAAGGR